MPKPLLDYKLVHSFPSNDGVLPLEAFRFGHAEYCGVQPSAWQSSEQSWDSDDAGRWRGPGAIWIHAAALRLSGAATEALGHDVIARVGMDAAPVALWEEVNPGFIAARGQWRVILQDAATGAVLLNALQSDASIQLPALSGHAILWVRLDEAERDWSLPPDYLEQLGRDAVERKYRYTENGVAYIWDWVYDVGRRPTDHAQLSQTGALLWDEYNALLLNGGLQHYGAWSQYISDGGAAADGGPWSALRITVGDGEFAVGDDFQPAPGAVLYRLDSAGEKTPVPVDPLALSISAFGVMEYGDVAGEARLGGTIATTSGTRSAYWSFHPEGSTPATLLGVSRVDFVPVCEASLYPNVSDILQRGDETEMMLTHSHLHRYDADAAIPDALPGVPLATGGHPGGRCLREADGRLHWFTEYFGGVGKAAGNDAFAQFYNTLKTLSRGETTGTGRGTVFHGDNCAETLGGRFYGWAQDRAFGDDSAQQFLAFQQNGRWVADEFAPFPADAYRWQRLRGVYTSTGRNLVVCGKEADSERALWGVMDGATLREASLNFRPRRLTECGGELYVVGRFVEEVDGVAAMSASWSVIRLHGTFVKVCAYWDEDAEAFTFSRATAVAVGLDPAKLPPFLQWNADASQPAGGYWTRADEEPEGVQYLALTDDGTTIQYAPVPDASSLPYSIETWDHFCFVVYDDGGVDNGPWPPEPKCENAGCAGDGQKYLIVSKQIAGTPWDAIQVSDVCDVTENGLRKLHAIGATLPNLWLRVDSTAPLDDLESYDFRCRWNQYQSLPRAARERIDVCVLVPPDAGKVFAPVIDRRDG